MPPRWNLPQPLGRPSQPNHDHFDLLAFLSIAFKFKVDFFDGSWQKGLPQLGGGTTSLVAQGSLDAAHSLAFKIQTPATAASFMALSSEQNQKDRFKTLIYELAALESLRSCPYVIDLIGIAWEVELESGTVWPVLLTEKSNLGTLADFLDSERGLRTSVPEKLELCGHIAKSCYAMHEAGIVYGDLKPQNILVFETADGLVAKAIDFGYSCFGVSASSLVKPPRTRPYQAPEHVLDKAFPWSSAQKMDLFTFGLLLCRIFMWNELVSELGGSGYSGVGTSVDALDAIDNAKKTPLLMEGAVGLVQDSKALSDPEKSLLVDILRQTIHHDPQARFGSFQDIISKLDPVQGPTPLAQARTNIDKLMQDVFDIGDVLDDLDRVDYLARQTLFGDLKNRCARHKACACFSPSAKQLSLCYEIGLGTKRDRDAAARWRAACADLEWDVEAHLKAINKRYGVRSTEERDRIDELVGYESNEPIQLYETYRVQKRLTDAEQMCRRELEGRRQTLGERSRPYVAQLMHLAMIMREQGQEHEGEMLQLAQQAWLTLKEAYGSGDLGALGAGNFLANALFTAGRFDEVEAVQKELMEMKLERYGPPGKHRTHETSIIMLVGVYYFQERYDECLALAQKLLEMQRARLSEEDPEVLNTRMWVCRAWLVIGDAQSLVPVVRELVRDHETVLGDSEDTLTARELLARALLALAKPEPSAAVVDDLVDESLRIVDGVLEVVDPCRDCGDISSGEDESGDAVMDDPEPPTNTDTAGNGDFLPDDAAVMTDFNFSLLLLARTTYICGLAFKGDFEEMEDAIELVGSDDFLGKFGESHIDVAAFRKVMEHVEELKHLLEDMSLDSPAVGVILWKLAHRWIS